MIINGGGKMSTLFDKPGRDNTDKALEVMLEGIQRYGVRQVVVASTWGDTGIKVAKLLRNMDINIVVVTHNAGFKEPGTLEMTSDIRGQLEEYGVRVCTGTMPFRNIGTAIREKIGYSQQDLVANVLRMFSQGVKVCVEIAMMASDAGLITSDDVLTVAGTGRGADTVLLISPRPSNQMFDLKIRDILAKPA
jgi:hypothetical protein